MSTPPPVPPYAAPHTPAPQKPNALAIVALVVGCVAILLWPLGLVAIALGVVALVKTRNPHVGGRGLAIGGIAAGAASLLLGALLISILLPSLNRAREAANRIKCASNLRQIGLAMTMYANESPGGVLPASFAETAAAFDLEPGTFVCPSSDHTPAAGTDWQQTLSGPPSCSYVYAVPRGSTARSLPAHAVVAYELPANHDNAGGNVLFADGTTAYQPTAQLRQTLAAQGVKLP